MPFRLVIPAARTSAMTGARSAAVRLARADCALSAVFGALLRPLIASLNWKLPCGAPLVPP
jgi:hypothetical protein